MTTNKLSQCQIIGKPRVQSWDDYEQGCLATYGGGHHSDGHLDAYQHGMSTVFNLLRAEFPPAEQCKTAPALLNLLTSIRSTLVAAPELNMANYTDDDAAALNDAVAAVCVKIDASGLVRLKEGEIPL